MAAPTNTPSTGEIWHLSIDDLLAPLPEVARLGGTGPFVINLSASTAPIALPAKSLAGCEQAHMYQLQRMEDRRPRYRLRVGPFGSEDEADAILKIVRDIYPGALTATADADDLRAIAALRAKIGALPPAPQAMPPRPAANPPAPQAMPPRPAANPPVSVVPTASPVPPMAPAVPTLTNVQAAPAPPKVPAMPTVEQQVSVRVSAAIPTLNSPVPRQAEQPSKRVPALDATQTVRALTPLELEDASASRWFVIQLSLAEDAFDPDTLPNLDIFSVYRLYSVAGIDQGRIMHALRLGFFTEEIAAGAVASYLAAFYDKPTIKRVSSAERDRFAEQSLEPRKDVGATGKHATIEITSERFVRERRSG